MTVGGVVRAAPVLTSHAATVTGKVAASVVMQPVHDVQTVVDPHTSWQQNALAGASLAVTFSPFVEAREALAVKDAFEAATATEAAIGAAETAVPRTSTSSDPLVANLANEIEAAYPGHVVGVNVPVRNAAGQLVTDADIQLQNAIIQVKSGGGKGLTSQVLRTEQATGMPTIAYGPRSNPAS